MSLNEGPPPGWESQQVQDIDLARPDLHVKVEIGILDAADGVLRAGVLSRFGGVLGVRCSHMECFQ